MVSVKLQGGLGNQLFQMAACIAHALRNGFEYAIPLEIDNPHYEGQKPYKFPGVNYCDKVPDLPPYQEPSFTYTPIPPIDNIVLTNSYFQSEKYFDDYREEILKAFGFKYEKKKNVCSIHIRLGDYLSKLDCHPPITKGYLFEAMMSIMTRVQDWEAIKFLVFSDSMNMAKEMLSSKEFKSFPIEYSEGKNEIEDLELMSSCEHCITANSAYSWWAAYLNQNPNKIIIHPRIWFGKEMQHNTKDLYIPGSIII